MTEKVKSTESDISVTKTLKDNNTNIINIIEDVSVQIQSPTNKAPNILDQTNLEELKDIIFDFDNSIDDRIKAFMIWHEQPNDLIYEITNKLTTMYLFSGSSMIKEFLVAVIMEPGIHDIIKMEFAKTLCYQQDSKENYDILNQTIQIIESIAVVLLLDCIILLMKSDDIDHIQQSRDYFNAIINNQENDEHFRYRTILSLEFKLPDSEY